MPLGSLPVLALGDGKVATQSMAIARYVAKLAKLYPANPLQALFVDEVLDVIGDIMIGLPPNPDTEEGKKQRLAYLDGKCKIYFSYLAEKLQAGGHFLFGTQATLADVQLYFALKYFCTLPLIPADYTAQWPQFAAFVAVYENDAVFSAYKI